MKNTVKKKITIKAPVSEVWNALTNPDIIRQYFFGTHADSDWQTGSSITYSGTWDGKEYRDKGKILEIEEERKLSHTHWSSLSGTEDVPENYYTVTYSLEPKGEDQTILKVSQEGNMSRESASHSGKNWEMVLEKMKGLLESQLAH